MQQFWGGWSRSEIINQFPVSNRQATRETKSCMRTSDCLSLRSLMPASSTSVEANCAVCVQPPWHGLQGGRRSGLCTVMCLTMDVPMTSTEGCTAPLAVWRCGSEGMEPRVKGSVQWGTSQDVMWSVTWERSLYSRYRYKQRHGNTVCAWSQGGWNSFFNSREQIGWRGELHWQERESTRMSSYATCHCWPQEPRDRGVELLILELGTEWPKAKVLCSLGLAPTCSPRARGLPQQKAEPWTRTRSSETSKWHAHHWFN